jgi:hypothetical protein
MLVCSADLRRTVGSHNLRFDFVGDALRVLRRGGRFRPPCEFNRSADIQHFHDNGAHVARAARSAATFTGRPSSTRVKNCEKLSRLPLRREGGVYSTTARLLIARRSLVMQEAKKRRPQS